MAAVATWTQKGIHELALQTMNWLGANWKVMLCSDIPIDVDNLNFASAFSGVEVSFTGYTAGGLLLTNKSIERVDADNSVYFKADDPLWNASGAGSGQIFVFYRYTGDMETSPTGFLVDKDAVQVRTDTDFIIQFPNNRIASIDLA